MILLQLKFHILLSPDHTTHQATWHAGIPNFRYSQIRIDPENKLQLLLQNFFRHRSLFSPPISDHTLISFLLLTPDPTSLPKFVSYLTPTLSVSTILLS